MKPPKYICQNCGHSEQYTKSELVARFIIRQIAVLFIIFGVFFLIIIREIGIVNVINILLR